MQSIEATVKNQAVVEEAYALLKSKGINFKYDISSVPVIIVKSHDISICLTPGNGEAVYISTKILETQQGNRKTKKAALNAVAAAISHEGVHVENAGKEINYFKNEAEAYGNQVKFMKRAKIKKFDGISLKELQKTEEAFEILSRKENLQILNKNGLDLGNYENITAGRVKKLSGKNITVIGISNIHNIFDSSYITINHRTGKIT
ncbi:MAG: hypothetical protein LBU09_00825, partial [Endomicrobium sp.]|nr:hypothetical protein [Endomicrobium sp.]